MSVVAGADLNEARHFADVAVERDYPITTAHLRTLLAELDRRGAAIERVRELHSRVSLGPGAPARCGECVDTWPCSTFSALDGE